MASHRSFVNGLPTAFKCAADNEWHAPDEFSKKQLSIWYQKKRDFNNGVSPENAGLVCKKHNSQVVNQEIKCHGPCNMWRYRQHFSKNQRTIPEPWCTKCTAWKTQPGGKEVPPPPPGSRLCPTELITLTSMTQGDLRSTPTEHSEHKPGTGEAGPGTLNTVGAKVEAIQAQVTNSGTLNLVGAASAMIANSWKQDNQVDESDVNITGRVQESAAYSYQSGSRNAASSLSHTQLTMPTTQSSGASQGYPSKAGTDTKEEDGVTVQGTPKDTLNPLPRVENNRYKTEFTRPSKDWAKGDNRKVFYAPPVYSDYPEDCGNADDEDYSSMDEF